MPTPDATSLVQEAVRGDPSAPSSLLPLVYAELRAMASKYLAAERAGHTLQATALVHEAYLRLVDQTQVHWKGKGHFCAVAATVMRRILVDHARSRARQKRGVNARREALDDVVTLAAEPEYDVLAIDEALTRLAELSERKARIVEMRFFAGMTVEETAEVLDISVPTVKRDWVFAKTWLRRAITQGQSA